MIHLESQVVVVVVVAQVEIGFQELVAGTKVEVEAFLKGHLQEDTREVVMVDIITLTVAEYQDSH